MSASLNKINAVVLFVSDLERARTFYGDTLGLTVQFDDEVSTGYDLGGTLLLLLNTAGARDLLSNEAVADQPPAGASAQHVSFVEDVDAIYADLTARGVEFVREPIDRDWGLRTAHFKDPDGNIWELAQPVKTGSNDG